jgi:isohexenylglutaconyl-CoA hydratase
VKNAMNYRMVAELHSVFTGFQGNRDVRVILIDGADGTFCAGGDIKEMRENTVPNHTSGANLDAMLRACNEADQIVIAKVEGAALGGGFGLVCVSDVAIASESAQFGLPEVRLGIAPAFISPYVIQRVGFARARDLMLTGRRFSGAQAYQYGLVHQVTPPAGLAASVENQLEDLRNCAPGAIAAIKQLMFQVADRPVEETVGYRADLLNALRAGEEAQAGMAAFLQKKSAPWAGGDA